MFERFTPVARDVVVHARDAAVHLGHESIGTEHLLLGLLRTEDTIAARALADVGVTTDAVRGRLEPGSREHGSTGQMPFTPEAKRGLESSASEADALGHSMVGTEHVLLGLVAHGTSAAVRVLDELGVTSSRVRERVLAIMSGE